MFVMRRFATMK